MKSQEMHSDIFYWRGVGFLLTVVMPLRVRFMTAITKRESKAYLKTLLDKHIMKIQSHGYTVRKVFVDPQGALVELDGVLSISMDISGARQHVSIVERHIRTIKERLRSTECGLRYKCPRRMVVGLVYFVISRLNLFPASEQKDGTSPKENYLGSISPYTLLSSASK